MDHRLSFDPREHIVADTEHGCSNASDSGANIEEFTAINSREIIFVPRESTVVTAPYF